MKITRRVNILKENPWDCMSVTWTEQSTWYGSSSWTSHSSRNEAWSRFFFFSWISFTDPITKRIS